MGDKGDAAKALSRHLQAAIEQVREDVEKVEFWAEAVAGFSQPVPNYDVGKVNVWVPSEQATALTANDSAKASGRPAAAKCKADPIPRRR